MASLNLEERRKELFDLDARFEQRNTERRERFAVLKAEDDKAFKLTKLTLDDLAKGADFHPYDPTKENEDYIRRAKDPVAELNDAPDWPNGLDPIKREGVKVLADLVDATEKTRSPESIRPRKR
ncbi:MAG: carboxy terminal-processing peptidase [Luteolibacter sp.]